MEALETTGAVGASGGAGHFFALAAQRSLASILPSALRYALTVLAQRQPSQWAWTLRAMPEINGLISLLVESHFLRRCDASFSEHFYGMRRASAARTGSRQPPRLTLRQRMASLFFLVVLPYVRERLKTTFGGAAPTSDEGEATSLAKRLRAIMRKLYPYLQALWESAVTVYQIMYLLGKTTYFSPELHLCGLHLVQQTREDAFQQQLAAEEEELGRRQWRAVQPLPVRVGSHLLDALSAGIRIAFPVTIFSLSVAEWWYTSDLRDQTTARAPVARPPAAPLPARKGTGVPLTQAICPCCRRPRTNPAAIATSGYVFCYSCAHRAIERDGRCPVSHLPASVDQLIPLYVEDPEED